MKMNGYYQQVLSVRTATPSCLVASAQLGVEASFDGRKAFMHLRVISSLSEHVVMFQLDGYEWIILYDLKKERKKMTWINSITSIVMTLLLATATDKPHLFYVNL